MNDNSDKINELLVKLDFLYRKQKDFSKEISDLRSEINSLKAPSSESTSSKKEIGVLSDTRPAGQAYFFF